MGLTKNAVATRTSPVRPSSVPPTPASTMPPRNPAARRLRSVRPSAAPGAGAGHRIGLASHRSTTKLFGSQIKSRRRLPVRRLPVRTSRARHLALPRPGWRRGGAARTAECGSACFIARHAAGVLIAARDGDADWVPLFDRARACRRRCGESEREVNASAYTVGDTSFSDSCGSPRRRMRGGG